MNHLSNENKREVQCPKCKTIFKTTSRVKKYCNDCSMWVKYAGRES